MGTKCIFVTGGMQKSIDRYSIGYGSARIQRLQCYNRNLIWIISCIIWSHHHSQLPNNGQFQQIPDVETKSLNSLSSLKAASRLWALGVINSHCRGVEGLFTVKGWGGSAFRVVLNQRQLNNDLNSDKTRLSFTNLFLKCKGRSATIYQRMAVLTVTPYEALIYVYHDVLFPL